MYAYLFGELTRMGVDVAGESQLVGYPTQFPSVSMVDWNDGKPNARFRVLELLHSNFGPGDKVVDFHGDQAGPYVYALPFVTRDGKERLLLVNKSEHEVNVQITGAASGQLEYVDPTTGMDPAKKIGVDSDTVTLRAFAVAALTLK